MELASQQSHRTSKGAQRAEEEGCEELASGTCRDGLLMLKAARSMEELGDATVWVVTPQQVEFQSVTACNSLAMFCSMDRSCFHNYQCREECTTFGVPMRALQQVVRATVANDALSFRISSQLDKISFAMKPTEYDPMAGIMEGSPTSSTASGEDPNGYQSEGEEKEDEQERNHRSRLVVKKRCGREAEFNMNLIDIDNHKTVAYPERLSDDTDCLAIVSLSSRALHEIVRAICAEDTLMTIVIEPLHPGDVKNARGSKIVFRTHGDDGPINGAQSLKFAGADRSADGAPAAKRTKTADPLTRLVVAPEEDLYTVVNATHLLRMAKAAHRLMKDVRLKVTDQELCLVTEMGAQGRFTSAMPTQILGE